MAGQASNIFNNIIQMSMKESFRVAYNLQISPSSLFKPESKKEVESQPAFSPIICGSFSLEDLGLSQDEKENKYIGTICMYSARVAKIPSDLERCK